MPIFEMTKDAIRKLPETSFGAAGVLERADLQRLLRSEIGVISPNTLILSEEFSEWEDSSRRIDLLGIDKEANLVVIELKRTKDGGHMELQAIRYAAMVSTMTFERAVEVYAEYLTCRRSDLDARTSLLEFLEWEEPADGEFAPDVRIVLAAADFSKEVTTAVLWLNHRMLDIRCIRLTPYELEGRLLIDAQQIVPVPEAADYQIKIREKEQKERSGRRQKWDEASFMKQLGARKGEVAAKSAKELLDWISPQVAEVWWGHGEQNGGIVPIIRRGGVAYRLFRMKTDGWLILRLDQLQKKPPFTDQGRRKELLALLNRMPNVSLTEEQWARKARIPIATLTDPKGMEAFRAAVSWMVTQIESVPATGGVEIGQDDEEQDG